MHDGEKVTGKSESSVCSSYTSSIFVLMGLLKSENLQNERMGRLGNGRCRSFELHEADIEMHECL